MSKKTSTALVSSPGPQYTESIQQSASTLIRTGLFAETKDPAKAIGEAVAKISLGRQFGIADAVSMSGIIINKGKVTMSANLMLVIIDKYVCPVINKKLFKRKVIERTAKKCSMEVHQLTTVYTPEGKESFAWELCGPPLEFTMEDATKAGLATSETYRKFPANMLFARCASNVAKTYCNAAFGGAAVYTPDEIPGSKVKVDGETLEIIPSKDEDSTEDAEIIPQDSKLVSDLRAKLQDLIAKAKPDMTKFYAHYGVSSVEEMDTVTMSAAIQVLQTRIESPA
jgi:hypothetical protein